MQPERLVPNPFSVDIRVRYCDTDAQGVVYHGDYLRYLEVARVELLRARGISYRALEAEGTRLVVREARLRYRAPARFDDIVRVAVRVAALGRASILLGYDARLVPAPDGEARARDGGGAVAATGDGAGRLLLEAEVELACTGTDGRPCRLPESVRVALAADAPAATEKAR